MQDELDSNRLNLTTEAPELVGAPTPDRVVDSKRQAPSASRGEVHVLDYVKILYKRRWMACAVLLVTVVSTAVYSSTLTPIYEARARLLIEPASQNVVSFKEVLNEEQTRLDYYQTQYSLLQSRALARKTLDSLNLWSVPPFGGVRTAKGAAAPQGFSIRRMAGNAVRSALAVLSPKPDVPERPVAPDESVAQSRAIDALLSHLVVTPVRNSRLVDISYQLPDPVMATRITNALAHNYIDQVLDYKFLSSKEASDFLSAHLSEYKKQVQDAELALQKYREQTDAISPTDRENIVLQKLTQINADVTRAKLESIQKGAMVAQLEKLQSDPDSLDAFPAILSNAYIQGLKTNLADLNRQYAQLAQRYGAKTDEIIRIKADISTAQAKLSAEIQKVVQSVKTDYEAALSQERSLTTALEQQKNEQLSMNQKAITYGVLQRDVDSSRQIYDNLLQRTKETGVAGELKTSNIRIVDEAEVPRGPLGPNTRSNLMLAIFGGATLAMGLAFFFEYLDNRIKTPDEIKNFLGLAHLGMLPLLRKTDVSGGYPLINGAAPVNFLEAFRVIRTNVLFSTAQTGCQSVLVTSTGPSEGKSLVAANVAISLAQAGMRTLIIDADLRKPKVHTVFDIPQEPGLSNLLVGTAKASETVTKSSIAGLWLLPAGRIPPNPAELLGSQRFRDFLQSLRQHFDWIIIDSPPVMAVADASVIAHTATGVLFVVGAEMTSRHAASRAIEQLENTRAKFLGAVLNRVDLEHNSYYYSQYYRREYSDYYQKDASK